MKMLFNTLQLTHLRNTLILLWPYQYFNLLRGPPSLKSPNNNFFLRVYCEYASTSDQSFNSAEEQLVHFLSRTGRPGWKWMSLRPRALTLHNAHKKQDRDSYYCMYCCICNRNLRRKGLGIFYHHLLMENNFSFGSKKAIREGVKRRALCVFQNCNNVCLRSGGWTPNCSRENLDAVNYLKFKCSYSQESIRQKLKYISTA